MIIAEIAQAHDGSLGMAHSYIDALADVGVDAVKFQTHIAEAESSDFEDFRVKFSYEDKSRYDYWKRMEFSLDEWIQLKEHCDVRGVEFISSPFSIAAVDLLEKVGVKRYKIGSGEINNFLMLEKIAKTRKPIILSSGMSSLNEIQSTLDFLKNYKNDISLLQCTTTYPTPPEKWGLQMIPLMKSKFNIPIGFSDHSSNIASCLAATALGAEILEFHAVFDKKMFGPDAKASLTISEINLLVKNVHLIRKSLNSKYDKNDISIYEENKILFGKSLCVNKNLSENHQLTFDDLESKKPADKGISAKDFAKVIGKKVTKPLKKWDFLNNNNIK